MGSVVEHTPAGTVQFAVAPFAAVPAAGVAAVAAAEAVAVGRVHHMAMRQKSPRRGPEHSLEAQEQGHIAAQAASVHCVAAGALVAAAAGVCFEAVVAAVGDGPVAAGAVAAAEVGHSYCPAGK